MAGILAALVLLSALAPEPAAPHPIDWYGCEYTLGLKSPNDHLLDVTVAAPTDGVSPVDFRMPAWSPGRYVIFDFARVVQDVSAADERGRPLPWRKLDKQTWRVEAGGSVRVTLRYRVYAADLSGTFSDFDATHANVNGPSVFMYVVGRERRPADLKIEAPPDWIVVSAASLQRNRTRFTFPSYDALVDTPLEVAPSVDLREFEVQGRTFRVLIHQLGDRAAVEQFVADVERIVRAENAVMGLPDDLAHYTFFVHFDVTALPDGMEHSSSCQIVAAHELDEADFYLNLLETVAHEYFHTWNVERLRPVEFDHLDYSREVYTTSLWFAEGVTNYYALMSMVRAGLIDEHRFLTELGRRVTLLSASAGRAKTSLEQASFDTWLHTARRSAQSANLGAFTVDYYAKGELVAMLLDLEIRRLSVGARSLDDLLRRLYRTHCTGEIAPSPCRGYSREDIREAVAGTGGEPLLEFLRCYVEGTEELDFTRQLAWVGLELEQTVEGRGQKLGVRIGDRRGEIVVTGVDDDGAGGRAGLFKDDVVLSIDGTPVTEGTAKAYFSGRLDAARHVIGVRRGAQRREVVIAAARLPVTYTVRTRADAAAEEVGRRLEWLGIKHGAAGSQARQR
jgi:predicted metalloprotease with PDZ domain